MAKNKFGKMRTPSFRHGHGGGITLNKGRNPKKWDALMYFVGITKPRTDGIFSPTYF